jgi:ADP-dependent NAD(P)H-hydrate dehydratase / NAD(P)H-hydrate epimerase
VLRQDQAEVESHVSFELLTNAEMMRADQLTIAGGIDGYTLMKRAGLAVAEAAADLGGAGPILVIAGRGNNGGDGFVAATELLRRGHDVAVMLLCRRDTLKGDAALAVRDWPGEVLACDPAALGEPALIIDALFGAGLDRPVKGDPRALIEAMNASGAQILSVDLPSGINGSTGQVLGVAVNATESITFFRKKPGHLLLPGRAHCGRVRVADIGIVDAVLSEIGIATFENQPEFWRAAFPLPRLDGHKYSRGHALIASGGLASTGAARLSARGALRGGAGLVTVATPREALSVNAAALTAVMVRPVDTVIEFAELLSDNRYNACVIGPGCGVGAHTRDLVLTAIGAGRGAVLDADALTSFADEPRTLFDAIATAAQARVVLTPHDGEFARLFGGIDRDLSKLDRARQAAATSGAVVLLKGADTVVAAPDGRAAISANAPAWLATAGSGDVLAGMICAMLAQGVASFEAACIGAWMHGEAGAEAGPGLISEDLPEVLPAVFRRLYDEFGIAY